MPSDKLPADVARWLSSSPDAHVGSRRDLTVRTVVRIAWRGSALPRWWCCSVLEEKAAAYNRSMRNSSMHAVLRRAIAPKHVPQRRYFC